MEDKKQTTCPYFGECGGCVTQHVPYEVQLKNKKRYVLDHFKRCRVNTPKEEDVQVFSGDSYNYRNRMDFVFFSKGLGLRRRGRFDRIVEIRNCAISNNKINNLLGELWDWFDKNKEIIRTFNIKKKEGFFKYALIRAPEFTDDSTISFLINSDFPEQEEQIKLIKTFAETTSAKNIIIAKSHSQTDVSISEEFSVIKGSEFVEEKLAKKTLLFHSQSFFQNNSIMAEKMILYSKDILKKYETKNDSFIDLYGGVGTFGIPLTEIFKDSLLIESSKGSVECARKNIKLNNLNNMQAKCVDAARIRNVALRKYLLGEKLFIITDPPRSGMNPKTLKYLLDIQPEVLIYVSCNPKQMAREMKKLSRLYRIESLSIFDLFPQTNHIEAIVELKLSGNLLQK